MDVDDHPPAEPVEPPVEGASVRGTDVPPVVAVVVGRAGSTHLDACLEALAAAEYPDLTVLVAVDAAESEALTPRIGAVAPRAFVRPTVAEGTAAVLNDAAAAVAGAPFLLFVHDDTVVEPAALRTLVEEAYRSNAAVLGPKIVDPDRPEILREVGWSVDRFGVPHSPIERDELDQEQHDAVQDVFFVSDACMLVRADLFAALGGFATECDPAARELDLCWRARIAGARVMVVPDARVRHHEDDPEVPDADRVVPRQRLRALVTSTSALRLLWLLPLTLVIHLAEAIVHVVRRQGRRATGLLAAWVSLVRHAGEARRAHATAQSARTVSDREVHAFQYRGSARVSAYMSTTLHAPERLRGVSERGRAAASTATSSFRSVRGALLGAVLLLVLVGSRDLLLGHVSVVGQFEPWPGVGALVEAFTSEWRYAGLGAHSPAPPVFALMGLARVLAFGQGGLAQTVLVVAAIPFGMLGVDRLARKATGPGWAASVGAAAYGIVALARNAIELGSAGPLALFALAPWIALGWLQLSGLVPYRWPRRRIVVLTALGVALASASWPLAIAFPAVLALGILLAAPLAGDLHARALRGLLDATGAATGWALLLLVPWPLAFLAGGSRAAAFGVVDRPADSFGALLRFATGTNGAGLGGWALVATALVVTLAAGGERARWCARWWGVAVVAWLLAVLPAWLGTASPDPNGVLVPAALAVAMIAGIGAGLFADEVRARGFGLHQAAAAVAALLLGAGMLGLAGDVVGGRFRQPADDWHGTLAWMPAQRDAGAFRVLWLGSPDTVAGDPARSGALAFTTTADGPGDARALLPPPGGGGHDALARAVTRLRTGRTTRFGREVGPMAVRYVVVPERAAPDSDRAERVVGLGAVLRNQLDLREIATDPGLRVFENGAWLPGRAGLASVPARPTGDTPLPALDASRRPAATLWSQQYDGAWSAAGARRHDRAFGWANGFTGIAADAAITYDHQWWRWPLVALELVIVVLLARRALRRGRRRRRREADPAPAGEVTGPEPVAVAAVPDTGSGTVPDTGSGTEPGTESGTEPGAES